MVRRMWSVGAGVVALAMVVTVGTAGRAEAYERTEYVTSAYCEDILAVRAEGVGILEIEWREVNEPTFHTYRPAGVWSLTRNVTELVLYNETQVVYRVIAHDLQGMNREGFLIEHSSYCPYTLPS
jgi:hypothetical protein